MMKQTYSKYNPVSWMAQNHVAANLLILMMFISGIFYMQKIRQEIQPNYTFATVVIEMSYPGASPEEVEENIVLAIEASINSIEGLSRIISSAEEGKALIYADIVENENLDMVMQKVRNAVDSITSFPTDAERPSVRLDDDARWLTTIGISGEVSEKVMYQLFNRVKSDLLAIAGVIQVLPRVQKQSEISIEIPQAVLTTMKLTLPDIAQTINKAANDVPSGEIKTADSQYVLRVEGRREYGLEFANIPLKTDKQGAQITLGDVANINDGFRQSTSFFSYNGAAGMIIYVYQSKNSRTLELADQVHSYVEELNTILPESVRLDFPYKRINKFKDRMSMLIKNGIYGLLLVMLVLGVFLNPRLAFWVALSIPVVFISSFTFLYYLDVSINMVSMFAFIMTLGIVVDDAIIVGESIYEKRQQGLPVVAAVIQGANDMILPVLFAVGTNIIAFIPLLMLSGDMGQYLRSLPIVAVVVFSVSLLEALLVLPSHLNRERLTTSVSKFQLPAFLQFLHRVSSLQVHIASGFDYLRDIKYPKILQWSIKHRYTVVILFTGSLLLIVAWFLSHRIEYSWYPQIPTDQVSANVTMPADASIKETIVLAQYIEAAGLEAIYELGSDSDLQSRSVSAGISAPGNSKISFDLVSEKQRNFSQNEFVVLWREKVGDVTQARSLTFDFLQVFGGVTGVFVDMRHASNIVLETAARELAEIMKTIDGLVDITDGLLQGKKQLKYTLSTEAKLLGLSEYELGRQLRAAFFGVEAVRMLRDSTQTKVWVRLPPEERKSLNDLDNFMLRTSLGVELPLSQAAQVENSRTFATIKRENGHRNISVGGVIDSVSGNASLAKRTLVEDILPSLMAKYPGLKAGLKGSLNARSGQTTFSMIVTGLILASILIFALMASLFRSYIQGLIVILTIPYCIAAAVAGHVIMGYSLTANSLFSMVALAGMVVNGSLVLTSRMNQFISQGMSCKDALINGSKSRFRPIVLTSVTTTAGVLPMLFETSQQALFLVPFAITLSFGTVFSTLVVLILIPVFHVIHRDFK
ncbi:MAG: efflux RND transporter permease subunit [Alcanivoracaceae bacterium]|nr:efflux RND transporter permease subunit [Alcanivoracaceae bacterium]